VAQEAAKPLAVDPQLPRPGLDGADRAEPAQSLSHILERVVGHGLGRRLRSLHHSCHADTIRRGYDTAIRL
jgi:hypothetical protein